MYGKDFLTGVEGLVERHHIFGGALRKKSEKYGLVVLLSPWMHREGPEAAHRSGDTREKLKKYGQRKCMIEQGWDVDRFVAEFGRNWLTDAELDEIEYLQGEAEHYRVDWIHEEPKPKTKTLRFTVTVEELPF